MLTRLLTPEILWDCRCIQSLANGNLTAEVEDLICRLTMKDIKRGSMYIAATNQLVDIHNAKELVKAEGETRHYR